jgi:hypothetical protein
MESPRESNGNTLCAVVFGHAFRWQILPIKHQDRLDLVVPKHLYSMLTEPEVSVARKTNREFRRIFTVHALEGAVLTNSI